MIPFEYLNKYLWFQINIYLNIQNCKRYLDFTISDPCFEYLFKYPQLFDLFDDIGGQDFLFIAIHDIWTSQYLTISPNKKSCPPISLNKSE